MLAEITNAGNAEPSASDLTTISVTGENMLLRLSGTTVGLRNDDIISAQSAYNDKSAEINDPTFTHAVEGAGAIGYRARLTAEYKVEETMLDAQDLADEAEQLAGDNLVAQEAVVNALLVIEGCSLVTNADLTTAEE
jgi:hypothetical protein